MRGLEPLDRAISSGIEKKVLREKIVRIDILQINKKKRTCPDTSATYKL